MQQLEAGINSQNQKEDQPTAARENRQCQADVHRDNQHQADAVGSTGASSSHQQQVADSDGQQQPEATSIRQNQSAVQQPAAARSSQQQQVAATLRGTANQEGQIPSRPSFSHGKMKNVKNLKKLQELRQAKIVDSIEKMRGCGQRGDPKTIQIMHLTMGK